MPAEGWDPLSGVVQVLGTDWETLKYLACFHSSSMLIRMLSADVLKMSGIGDAE